MSEDMVEVPFGDDAQETAVLLLASAEELHEDQTIVRTGEGVFYVPADVAEHAGYAIEDEEPEAEPEPEVQTTQN